MLGVNNKTAEIKNDHHRKPKKNIYSEFSIRKGKASWNAAEEEKYIYVGSRRLWELKICCFSRQKRSDLFSVQDEAEKKIAT